MRITGLRLPILASLLLALAPVRSGADEVVFIETADWVPTVSTLVVPTSSLLATTAVIPTSYLVPTAYSTAYVLETAYSAPVVAYEPTYYETRLRRRGLFGRRWVETTRAYNIPMTAYYPTTYYYPTVFSAPAVVDRAVSPTEYVATTATSCCGTVVADVPAVVRAAPVDQVIDRPASSAQAPAPREEPRRPARIESEADDDSISSEVPPARTPAPAANRPAPARTPETRSPEVSPPPAPAAPKPAAPKPANAPAGGGGASPAGNTAAPKERITGAPPAAPGGEVTEPAPARDDDLFPAPEENKDAASKSPSTVRRDNLRPAFRTVRSDYRNVLVGIVRSRSTDDPEDNVRITLSSRNDPDMRREAHTNAFGKFAVRIPDGDWTVNVTMPSGRVYPVSQITVSGGMIYDDAGRDVPSLIITR